MWTTIASVLAAVIGVISQIIELFTANRQREITEDHVIRKILEDDVERRKDAEAIDSELSRLPLDTLTNRMQQYNRDNKQ